ncbi:hypothetical protein GKQ38_05250 [Candidatus Nanohaloarchaea archaeon]|nr:hypothetical protein GKQ38_05250 [Candidatus Nanohaloarchaea archaeon]
MKRKGLSQVLWLIIAAAVLMMVSMALTFTTQGTLGNFAQSTDANACRNTLSNKVAAQTQGDIFMAPRSCYSDDGNPVAYQGKLANDDGTNNRECLQKTSTGWESIGEASTESGCPAP